MLNKAAILIAIAMIAAACASDTAEVTSEVGATPTTVATADAATHDDDATHEEDAAHDDDAGTHEDDAAHEDDHDAAEVDRTIEVRMAEFSFSPASMTISRGETILFKVTNDGVIEHEFRLTTEHAAMEHVAAGHMDHGDEATTSDEHGHGEVLLLVAPGETDTITVTFDHDAEFDEMVCLLPSHYEAGMRAPLTL